MCLRYSKALNKWYWNFLKWRLEREGFPTHSFSSWILSDEIRMEASVAKTRVSRAILGIKEMQCFQRCDDVRQVRTKLQEL